MLRQLITALGRKVRCWTGLSEPTDRLGKWVSAQRGPFTLQEAAASIGFSASELTPNRATRIGIELQKLGCRKIEIRPPYQSRITRCYVAPGADQRSDFEEIGALIRAEGRKQKSFLSRENVSIGTTREHGNAMDNCTNLVRPPYFTRLIPACSEDARNFLSSSMSEANWSACSGCALSPNTLHTANHAGTSVSATIDTAAVECSGTNLARSALLSHLSNDSAATDLSTAPSSNLCD